MLQCGLSVPAFNRDNTLPAEEQWQEARQQWNMVRETWEEAARENGVISDGEQKLQLIDWRVLHINSLYTAKKEL